MDVTFVPAVPGIGDAVGYEVAAAVERVEHLAVLEESDIAVTSPVPEVAERLAVALEEQFDLDDVARPGCGSARSRPSGPPPRTTSCWCWAWRRRPAGLAPPGRGPRPVQPHDHPGAARAAAGHHPRPAVGFAAGRADRRLPRLRPPASYAARAPHRAVRLGWRRWPIQVHPMASTPRSATRSAAGRSTYARARTARPLAIEAGVHPDVPEAHIERTGSPVRTGWRVIDGYPSGGGRRRPRRLRHRRAPALLSHRRRRRRPATVARTTPPRTVMTRPRGRRPLGSMASGLQHPSRARNGPGDGADGAGSTASS